MSRFLWPVVLLGLAAQMARAAEVPPIDRENRVAMTNRPAHSPTEESNEQIYLFFELLPRSYVTTVEHSVVLEEHLLDLYTLQRGELRLQFPASRHIAKHLQEN
jgi:hypothetical protein